MCCYQHVFVRAGRCPRRQHGEQLELPEETSTSCAPVVPPPVGPSDVVDPEVAAASWCSHKHNVQLLIISDIWDITSHWVWATNTPKHWITLTSLLPWIYFYSICIINIIFFVAFFLLFFYFFYFLFVLLIIMCTCFFLRFSTRGTNKVLSNLI